MFSLRILPFIQASRYPTIYHSSHAHATSSSYMKSPTKEFCFSVSVSAYVSILYRFSYFHLAFERNTVTFNITKKMGINIRLNVYRHGQLNTAWHTSHQRSDQSVGILCTYTKSYNKLTQFIVSHRSKDTRILK